MKVLIVGLGSMGKRRTRCLKALGIETIAGFDLREDRRTEAKNLYGIQTFADFEQAVREFAPEAINISVPPDIHHVYMKLALEYSLPFFVEASVVDTDMGEIIETAKRKNIVAVPSLTLLFNPGLKIVHQLLQEGALGKVSNIIYHSGSYLPDWHTYERVQDFYVSNPATGGCREIVAFELSWLTHYFGFPKRVSGYARRLIEIEGAPDIDDTYNFIMDFGDFLATVTVDVASRKSIRRLLINGTDKQLIWSWEEPCVKLFDPESKKWEVINHPPPRTQKGYDENIDENMYVEETEAFLRAVKGEQPFPNSLDADHRVLKLLYQIEATDPAPNTRVN